ncbi:MAG: dipeptide/oligopeptide/nickel ABC transporter ATP-binding protein, partial [Oscillospiraceae bacterium]
MGTAMLEIKGLQKRYPIYGKGGKLFRPKDYMSAVSGLSLRLYEGETYGLVGESGCGKSTTGRMLLGLTKPDAGEIFYGGQDLVKLTEREFRPLRRELQLVFQDPLFSLNPRQRIGALLEEPLLIHKMGDGESRRRQVMEILGQVGLTEEHYFRYPHELSGGQVQRLGIARALIIRPKLIVCDEPVSALDVSIQAQILNMLTALQGEMHLSLLFISHDIGVVRYL